MGECVRMDKWKKNIIQKFLFLRNKKKTFHISLLSVVKKTLHSQVIVHPKGVLLHYYLLTIV